MVGGVRAETADLTDVVVSRGAMTDVCMRVASRWGAFVVVYGLGEGGPRWAMDVASTAATRQCWSWEVRGG